MTVAGCGGGTDTTPAPTPTPTPTNVGFFDPRFGTRYTNSSLTTIYPQIYIDPFNGNDNANGLTVATALKTSAGLNRHPLMLTPGASIASPRLVTDLTIGIIGHATERVRDSFDYFLQSAANGYRQMHRCSFVRVGSLPVHFDCTDIIAPSAFTPHSSIASAYVIQKAHTMQTDGTYRFRGFVNGKSLKRVRDIGDLRAGRYWYAGDPVEGAPKEIVFIDFDASDPRTSGRVVEFTTRPNAISMRSGYIQGIWAERNGDNNGSLFAFGGHLAGTSGPVGAPTLAVDCLLYEGSKHHAVLGAPGYLGCSAVNSMDDEYDPQGGAAYFTIFEGDVNGKQGRLEKCHMIVDTSMFPGHSVGQTSTWISPFLAHDGNADGIDLARLDVIDCSVIGTRGAVSGGGSDLMVVRGLYYPGLSEQTNGAALVALSGDGRLEIERSVLANADRYASAKNIKLRSCLIMSGTGNVGGQVSTVNQAGTIDIENCIIVASPQQAANFVDLNNGSGSFTFRRNLVGPGVALGIATYASPAGVMINSDQNG